MDAKQIRSVGKIGSKGHSLVTTSAKCSYCNGDYEIWKCHAFKRVSLSEKYTSLRRSSSCFNCQSKSEHSCKRCEKRHHTSLYPIDVTSGELSPQQQHGLVKSENSTPVNEAGTSSAPASNGSVLCANVGADQDTQLATAVDWIRGAGKRVMQCRAVLDSRTNTLSQKLWFRSLT